MAKKQNQSECRCPCCVLHAAHPDRSNLCPDAAYIFPTNHHHLDPEILKQLGEYPEFVPACPSPPGTTVYFVSKEAVDKITSATLLDLAEIVGSSFEAVFCPNS